MSKRPGAVAPLSLAVVAIFELAGGAQQLVDRILARVGGQIITLSDVRAAEWLGLAGEATDPTVDQVTEALVERELMRQEASRLVFSEPVPAVVDARLGAIRSRFASEAEFQHELARVALTEPRLRAWLRDDVIVEEYIEQRFTAAARPTSTEVETYYREHREELAAAGLPGPLDRIRTEVTGIVQRERRAALVQDWIARLRDRIPVVRISEGKGEG